MTFSPVSISGAWLIELEPREDERGWFARVWSDDLFAARGLTTRFVQCNSNYSHHAHTLRGLHYQDAPHAEVKLVRCIRGAVFDVIVDMRPESPSYRQWWGGELSEVNRRMLYVPEGCAHGFQTLREGSEVMYPVSAAYAPDAERGVRWDDPGIGIEWPAAAHRHLSDKDQAWPDLAAVSV